jgi:hypothetical protein
MVAKTQPRILTDLTAQRRIAELEQALAAAQSGQKVPQVTEQEYKGRPVLYFEGNFRPFHAGMGKLSAIEDNRATVLAFLKRHAKKGAK